MISFLAIERLLTDIHTSRDGFEAEVEHIFAVLVHELEMRKLEILSSAANSSSNTSTFTSPFLFLFLPSSLYLFVCRREAI